MGIVLQADGECTRRGLDGKIATIAGKDGYSLGLCLSVVDLKSCRATSVRAALAVLAHLRLIRLLGLLCSRCR